MCAPSYDTTPPYDGVNMTAPSYHGVGALVLLFLKIRLLLGVDAQLISLA